MTNRFIILSCLLALCLPAIADNLYKWVDDNGVVHYGDAVPAEASRNERYVLNRQGVTVKVLDRAKTIEELNAMAAAAARVEEQQDDKREQAERDRVLLDTYLSVEEIKMLRDRRVLAIEARIGVTRHYLENLRKKWDGLEGEVSKFNFPFDPASNLPPLPEELADQIVFTENAMAEYMNSLSELRGQQSALRAQFESDMKRFEFLQSQEMASTTP